MQTDPSANFLLGAAVFILIAWPRFAYFYKTWIAIAFKKHAERQIPLAVEWELTSIDELTPEQRAFLGRNILAFRSAGFEILANLRQKDEIDEKQSKIKSWVIPMLNPAIGDRASVTMERGTHIRALTFQVISEFADGFQMVTDNSQSSGVLPTDPESHRATFAWVSDPATLIEAHRRRVAQAGRAEHPRQVMFPSRVIEEVNESWRRIFNWLIRAGYYYRDSASDCVRPTWRGAFVSSWRNKPIIKRRLIRRRDAQAQQLWKQLGMEQWTPPTATEVLSAPSITAPIKETNTLPQVAEDALPEIAYQSKLKPGQVRRTKSNGTLTLRVMLPTASQIIERNLPHLGVIVLLASAIVSEVYHIWFIRHALTGIPRAWILQVYEPSYFRPDLLFLAGLLVFEGFQISKALSRRARGTTMISVSHEGLRLSDGPGPLRNGHFSREQIEALSLRFDQFGFGQHVYKLEARITGDRDPVILLVSRDPKPLGSLRRELLSAMGLLDIPAE
jgi:hypothetical protein